MAAFYAGRFAVDASHSYKLGAEDGFYAGILSGALYGKELA